MEIAISEFKAKCIQLIKSTAATGEELVITLRGRPLARVVGLATPQTRVLGGQSDAWVGLINDHTLIDSDLENDWQQ